MYPDTNTIKDVVNNNFKSYKINYNLIVINLLKYFNFKFNLK